MDFVSPVYCFIIQVFMGFCSVITTCLGLIYGILALIPTSPFDHQNLSLGIILIVLSCLGIIGLVGAIVGAIIGFIISFPIVYCLENYINI